MLGRVHRASTEILSSGWPPGPLRPPFPAAEVHVWRAELDAPGWPGAEGLPAPERERAAAILRPESGRRWIAARWALREVLGRYLDEDPAAIELRIGEHGKPELARDLSERLSFNLSHSGGLALIAVSTDREVGVDLERTEPRRNFAALAERGLDRDTATAIREAPPERRAAIFYAAWTRHEARAKCGGGGIWAGPPGGPMTTTTIAVATGYSAALAVAVATPPRLHEWSIRPLSGRLRR